VGPTLDIADIPNPSAGQKMHKPPSLDPDSLLGCMLKQDHAVYNQNSDPNSQFTLDKAFRDSHALLSIPGNTWQPPAPSTAVDIKEEGVVKDMMETLQQIIGDSSICGLQGFDVDESDLKEWENTLLKLNYSNDMELTEIISNDILSYVEDALFKENGVQLPEQLKGQGPFVEVPECLPEMELPNNLAANQEFNCQADLLGGSPGQGGFIGMSIQDGVNVSSPGRGMVKLTHMGPQMLPSDTFVQSFGQTTQKMPGNNNIIFNPSLAMQSQQLPQVRLGPVQENGIVPCGQRNLQTGNQPHHNAVTLPLQSQPMGLHSHNSLPQQPTINQNPQWVSDSNNMVDNLLNPCTHNVSGVQDAGLHSGPTAQLQGQFSLHTQNAANPGLPSWQQSQPTPQQVSTSFSSGQQNMTGFIGQVTDFQRDVLGELMTQTNAQGFGSGFLPQTTANSIYPQQGEIINNSPRQTTNSCMFISAPQPSVNGMQYGSADPVSSMSSCQRAKGLVTQSPTQASCYYQRGPSKSIVGTSAIPQEDTSISPMACQVPLGLTPDNILAQQYLSCNGQTQ
ncbi:hypothetical protein M9458_044278, partial [Cirrhinus mrigala]